MVRPRRVERLGLTALAFIALIAALFGLILGGHSAARVSTLSEPSPAAYVYDVPAAPTAAAHTHYDASVPSVEVRTVVRVDAVGRQPPVGALRSQVGAAWEGSVSVSGFVVAAKAGGGRLAGLRAAMADDTGAIGPGVGNLKFARKVGLPADSPLVVNRELTVDDFISRFRKSGIRGEMPGEYLDQSVADALRAGDSTLRKLLTSSRWTK